MIEAVLFLVVALAGCTAVAIVALGQRIGKLEASDREHRHFLRAHALERGIEPLPHPAAEPCPCCPHLMGYHHTAGCMQTGCACRVARKP